MNMTFLKLLIDSSFWALIVKEFNQIKRNKQILFFLLVPPAIQIIVLGFALDPIVSNMSFGVTDENQTGESRELTSAFTENRAFRLKGFYASTKELERALTVGELDVGLVIPKDFAKKRARGEAADIQIFINGVNSNTAAIAEGYTGSIVTVLNQKFGRQNIQIIRAMNAAGDAPALTDRLETSSVSAHVNLLYNPGLVSSWYIVTGVFGVILMLNAITSTSTAMISEKEAGTVEQLLMTPANTLSVVIAKLIPLFFLMMVIATLVLTMMLAVFRVPLNGSIFLMYLAAALCSLCGISIGTLIATFAKNSQQSELLGFFVIPPLAMLSGALTPIEAIPKTIQFFTFINPVRHFAVITPQPADQRRRVGRALSELFGTFRFRRNSGFN